MAVGRPRRARPGDRRGGGAAWRRQRSRRSLPVGVARRARGCDSGDPGAAGDRRAATHAQQAALASGHIDELVCEFARQQLCGGHAADDRKLRRSGRLDAQLVVLVLVILQLDPGEWRVLDTSVETHDPFAQGKRPQRKRWRRVAAVLLAAALPWSRPGWPARPSAARIAGGARPGERGSVSCRACSRVAGAARARRRGRLRRCARARARRRNARGVPGGRRWPSRHSR
jgi:hypothetical protein